VTMMQGGYWVVVAWGKASALHPWGYVACSDYDDASNVAATVRP